jgi:hypothetical protein
MIGDLLRFSDTAEIVSPLQGNVVRKLRRIDGETVELDALAGPVLQLQALTPVEYQPWVFDRGSLLIEVPTDVVPDGKGKLCTESDVLRTPDGREFEICAAFEACVDAAVR